MRFNSINILEVNVTTAVKEEILEEIEKRLTRQGADEAGRGKTVKNTVRIVTPNPEQIVFAGSHPEFRDFLNRADVALPDGIGLVFASRILHGGASRSRIRARIAGADFMEDLVRLAHRNRVRIGLIGGRAGVAVAALECLRSRYPGLTGWALEAPEFSTDDSEVLTGPIGGWEDRYVRQMIENGTGIVFIGLGAPKQEYMMASLERKYLADRKATGTVVFMSVGGAIDFLAGTQRRAPLFIRLIGFEWLWRLLREPWRWRRQLALPAFAGRVLRTRFFRD